VAIAHAGTIEFGQMDKPDLRKALLEKCCGPRGGKLSKRIDQLSPVSRSRPKAKALMRRGAMGSNLETMPIIVVIKI
jgi:hypothetical protein